MNVNVNLSSEIEARIRDAMVGQDVESFVLQAVTEKLEAELIRARPSRNGSEWREKLRACIDLHPVVAHFVDDSRESIYASRGE